MCSKSNNIEIMINDEADEVIKELFDSFKNRHQNDLEPTIRLVCLQLGLVIVL